MRRRLRSNNTNILKLAMVGIVAMAGGFLLTSFLGSKSETQALSATEFQAGRIIDDSIFYNPNTMTAAEIDAFIDSHSPACDMWGTQMIYGMTRAEYVKQLRAQGQSKYHDPPFVCVSEYYENPTTHKTNFSTGGRKEAGMLSAGEIIYAAAHEYNINPQVLLVMLKKESYVWGDDWPHDFQYNTVMGYACPDGAPCDSKYFGFYNQVMMAAWQLNYYREHIYSYNYRPYATNNILYNPDRSCGSKSVYLENLATTSLYIYTPYVPNDAALANYPGTSYCGSYGNRNFYMYFREWFGNALGTPEATAFFSDGDYYVVPANDNSKSLRVEENNDENGAKYYFDERTDSTYSRFKLERQSDGSYVFINVGSQKAIDIYDTPYTTTTAVSQWRVSRSTMQKYAILNNRDGTYSFAPSNNRSFVVVFDDENGSHLSWRNYAPSQSYKLIHADQQVRNGTYIIRSKLDEGRAIDVTGGSINKAGTNIELWSLHRHENQRFNVAYDANSDYYKINPVYTDSLFVSAKNENKSNLTNIQLASASSSCAQNWYIDYVDNNAARIVSSCSGLAWDIEGGKSFSGANIALYTNHNHANQQWIFEEYKEPEPEPEQKPQETNNEPVNTPEEQQNTTPEEEGIITGNHYIRSAHNKRFSVDITGISAASGTNIELWDSHTGTAQLFKFTYYPETKTYRISDTYTNRSLDAAGGSSKNGVNLIMWSENGGCNQRWHILKNDDNTYRILDSCGGRAIDVFNNKYSAGANIGIWDYHGGSNQKWTIE